MSPPASGAQDPSSYSSRSPTSTTASGPRGTGPTQSQFSWGGTNSSGQKHSSRRVLTPISTGTGSGLQQARPTSASSNPSRGPFSPTFNSFNHAANRQISSDHSSASSSGSTASPSQQHSGQLLSGARSRAIASGSAHLANSAGSLSTASQGGVVDRGSTHRLVRQSPSLSLSATGSPVSVHVPHSTGFSGGQLTSLVITQLNILLSTIREDKDRGKWEAQADRIGKLVDASGMEVFTSYFRRLLSSNASTIFPGVPRQTENPGSYQLLVTEMQKILHDPQQAEKIAQSLDTSDGDLFHDFDLSAFVEHFRLDPIAKVALALPCRKANKQDLRTKADAIVTSKLSAFFHALSNPPASPTGELQDEPPPSLISSILERLILDPPRTWNEEQRTELTYAVRIRYSKFQAQPPKMVNDSLFLSDLMESQDSYLVRLLHRAGPRGTSSLEACRETLQNAEIRDIAYPQIANALLFMVFVSEGTAYDVGVFVEGLRQHRAGRSIDWTDVVSEFDKEMLKISKRQFLTLYHALLPLAKQNERFDIQSLWGGQPWQHQETQLSFVVAFLSSTPEELDVTQIPDLRRAITEEEFEDASDDAKAFAAQAVKHPLVSRDATEALFTMIFKSQETYNYAQSLGIPETLINPNMAIFVCAASAVPKPWVALQDQALKQLFYPFLLKQHANYDFVMHSLWTHDKTWVAGRMVEFYTQDHMLLIPILEHAQEHGWLDALLTIQSGFVLDLATMAHGKRLIDLKNWAQQHIQLLGPPIFARAIVDFLTNKLEDERLVQREHVAPTTPPLTVKTVHTLLSLISVALTDEELGQIQRECLTIYPRLINYGGDYDAIIDANGAHGNALPDEAGAQMEDQYKKMYGSERDVREVLETLRRLRDSDNGPDQDLFASMIHGLFDEYNCFGEYPLEALATTAVLFGGIVNFSLLSRIALQVALYMVLEAVSDFTPEDSMYKFGLQAMIHFIKRLDEWPSLCERLLHIPQLQETEVVKKAEEVMQAQGLNGNGLNGAQEEGIFTNGSIDEEFPADSPTPPFSAVRVDPPVRTDIYEEPSEDTSDKIMFVLNNVSKRNLDDKFKDLEVALEEKHHQWFARYLVERLAKSQPNFQGLYLQILDNFDERKLWAEVMRQTYASCAKMLNAQATMDSTIERANLKNLAIWLGTLTLARNQPILQRNLSFKDLLLEAYDTQRLLVALPFTCKVIVQAQNSKIFRPPNPWLMELLGILAELYHCFELKLNLKFEIEVLCKDLGLDIKQLEPSRAITDRPTIHENNMLQQYVPDGGDSGFGDMHLMSLSKRAPNERFSPASVIEALPDLASMLTFPTIASNINQHQLRQIFLHAAQQAVHEIIAPVVERSVTIASISTSELLQKDFAMEGDPEKLQQSAHNVVQALSGSLALVTCKEPLRMSITNNLRILAARNLPDQLPEGQILMFVNDNLDTVCKLVEQAAEAHSLAEIDAQLTMAIEQRRAHQEQRSNEPYNFPPVSRWAQFIPEPYRQQQPGLNEHQLAIYEDFGRQVRNPPMAHANSVSQDSNRQLPDVLSDSYLPNLPTPAEAPAMPRQTPQQQRIQQAVQSQHQVNGYTVDQQQDVGARIREAITEIQSAARMAMEENIQEIGDGAQLKVLFDQLVGLILASPQRDMFAVATGQHTLMVLYSDTQKRLEIEVLVQLLATLCEHSDAAKRHFTMYLAISDDDKVFNASVTACLIRHDLVDIRHVDSQVARALKGRRAIALEYLRDLIDELLVTDSAPLLRADFAHSFDALCRWLNVDPNLEVGKQIIGKLQVNSDVPNGLPSPPEFDKQDQLEYIFEEWIRLQEKDTSETGKAAFIQQMHRRHIINDQEDATAFFRACLEMSCAAFDRTVSAPWGTLDSAYVSADAVAKLVVSMVIYQSAEDGASKVKYLEALVRLLCLLINHYHNTQGERFNGRVYFRLFSSLLCELHGSRVQLDDSHQEVPSIIGRALLVLQPRHFPRFAFSWLALVSHRLFVPALLKTPGRTEGGWDLFTKLLGALFTNLRLMISDIEASPITQDFYRGVVRLMLMLHHDFPEFLCENHMLLDSQIPNECHQLRNLVNSATPMSYFEQPDPYTQGLKINRLEQVRQAPAVRGNLDKILGYAGIRDTLDDVLGGTDVSNDEVTRTLAALDAANASTKAGSLLPNALVLYVGVKATVASSVFSSGATPARLLERLLRDGQPNTRYNLISAMVNQLRYVNAHTHYFSTAILHIFTTGSSEVQQQIARVLIERVIPSRPHPWGLIVTLLELVKNQAYDIWTLPWMKAAPQVESMMMSVAHTTQDRMARSPMRGIM